MPQAESLANDFEIHRAHLRAVAYRMLRSQGEADDAVQEAWLRLSRSHASAIREPRRLADDGRRAGNDPEDVMPEPHDVVRPIGRVESILVGLGLAPNQGDEGSPDAWLVFDPMMRPALPDLVVGTDVIVLTWLDRTRIRVRTLKAVDCTPVVDIRPRLEPPGQR